MLTSKINLPRFSMKFATTMMRMMQVKLYQEMHIFELEHRKRTKLNRTPGVVCIAHTHNKFTHKPGYP